MHKIRHVHNSVIDTEGMDVLACRFVWLNQYADQFLPIVALVGLRVIVGLGDKLIKLVTKPKKDPMQVTSCEPHHMLFTSLAGTPACHERYRRMSSDMHQRGSLAESPL